MRLAGKVAVVTGASSGIGRATARACLAAGWNVALLGRRAEALREATVQVDEARLAEALQVLEELLTAARGTTYVSPDREEA